MQILSTDSKVYQPQLEKWDLLLIERPYLSNFILKMHIFPISPIKTELKNFSLKERLKPQDYNIEQKRKIENAVAIQRMSVLNKNLQFLIQDLTEEEKVIWRVPSLRPMPTHQFNEKTLGIEKLRRYQKYFDTLIRTKDLFTNPERLPEIRMHYNKLQKRANELAAKKSEDITLREALELALTEFKQKVGFRKIRLKKESGKTKKEEKFHLIMLKNSEKFFKILKEILKKIILRLEVFCLQNNFMYFLMRGFHFMMLEQEKIMDT